VSDGFQALEASGRDVPLADAEKLIRNKKKINIYSLDNHGTSPFIGEDLR
jgi:hypothetical protein